MKGYVPEGRYPFFFMPGCDWKRERGEGQIKISGSTSAIEIPVSDCGGIPGEYVMTQAMAFGPVKVEGDCHPY